MKTINIKTIRIDGGTQSRVEINNEIVTEYAEAIKVGAEFPAVVVFSDGADNWLADGFHRFHAHNQAGKASIAADVRTGTVRDAILFSLGANGSHGLRRSNADKRKAVQTILADFDWSAWSDRKIAEVCGVGHPFVAAIRKPEVAEKQQVNRDSSAAKKSKAVESDSTQKPGGVESDSTQSKKSELSLVPTPTPEAEVEEPEYTPLDAANDQIQDLQAALVVANIHSADSEEASQAATLIAELRAHIKTLEATLKAVKVSRDTLQNENAELRKQITRQRREIDKVTGRKTA